jgi:uncharacterized membrane protein
MPLLQRFSTAIKKYFVSGVLVVVPVILTWLVLRFLFRAVDGILQPVLYQVFGYWVSGLGVLTTVLLIVLAGILTRNIVGSRLHAAGERVLSRMPIIRPIYTAAKQLLEGMAQPAMRSFRAVVTVEYPRRGAWVMAFLTRRLELEIEGERRRYAAVFVPSTPTPVSGNVIMVPEDEAIELDMTVEEGVKFLVSGGVACPPVIRNRSVAAV